MRFRYLGLIILYLLCYAPNNSAQEPALPPCGERNFLVEYPRIEPDLWCLERPMTSATDASMTYTALQFDEGGNLYATNPFGGELVVLRDTDADGLPDTELILEQGLHYPNGLAHAAGRLYILGDGVVYAYQDETLRIIRDDLPHGRGFMARAIAVIGAHLYIGIPMPCDFCVSDDPLHGTVVRMRLDGTDLQVVARGLRFPTALVAYRGALWVTDQGRDHFLPNTAFDEINRIDLTSDFVPHFGFPYCVGAQNQVDWVANFDCTTAIAPTITLSSDSHPIALAHYEHDSLPWLRDSLLVGLEGAADHSFVHGHSVVAIRPLEAGRLVVGNIVPTDNHIFSGASAWISPHTELIFENSTFVNRRAGGIFPMLIFSVTISPEGWIYYSTNGGNLYVIRPIRFPDNFDLCASGLWVCVP